MCRVRKRVVIGEKNSNDFVSLSELSPQDHKKNQREKKSVDSKGIARKTLGRTNGRVLIIIYLGVHRS